MASLSDVVQPFLALDDDGHVEVTDGPGFRSKGAEALVRHAVFGPEDERVAARYLLWEAAHELGATSASIHELYMGRGRGQVSGFTVPAMNLRGMTFDVARAAWRAAHSMEAGALIFEIARSEQGYTGQAPSEYATAVLGAAVAEGHQGPVFIQGDHYQFKPAAWSQDPEGALADIRGLTAESLEAGFHNIDIDASTLVDLSKPTVPDQQAVNAELTATMASFIRERQPEGVQVSIGGEIGEVGKKNSTPEELRAYLDLVKRHLDGSVEVSKVSVQTGTTHGGVPRPDGSVAEVAVDFDTLERLSRVCVEEYGLAGAVQHGASTLPDDLFHKFRDVETAEIHLATGFQNTLLDHEAFPEQLRERIYRHLDAEHPDERKPDWTDHQFHYKTRKKCFGPFKAELWDLPPETKRPLMDTLEQRFSFIFRELGIDGTAPVVERFVHAARVRHAVPPGLRAAGLERNA